MKSFFITLIPKLVFSHDIIFPVVGDYGGKEEYPYWTSSMEPVAQSMDKLCEDNQCDCFVSIGDNFYQDGVHDIYDERWTNVVENVFGKSSNRKNLKGVNVYKSGDSRLLL